MSKLRVVPYGADLDAFEQVGDEAARGLRLELGLSPDDLVVGSVGRLVEQKDYPTQMRAFALASSRVPALRMVIAGDGPLGEALRADARSLGIEDRVRFVGHWTRVPLLLRMLDIFVLASKFEPFGVAILEAKAAGAAIVATRVNEIPEIIADGETGLLCEPEDAESMATLMIRLADAPELRRRLGAGARRDAVEHHSLSAAVDAYQNLYESCF